MLSEDQQQQPEATNNNVPADIRQIPHCLPWNNHSTLNSRKEKIAYYNQQANTFAFKTALLVLVHSALGRWGDLLPRDISVHLMTAALTNTVLKVVHDKDDALVIKIHEYTDVALKELKWLRVLSTTPSTHAPSLLAEFGNGHIEECKAGMELSVKQMRNMEIAEDVMRAVAEIHALYEQIGGGDEDLFKRLERWRGRAGVKGFERITSLMYTQSIIEECVKVNSPLVLSHNDLQMGNILLNAETREITLVDYEYSGIAPRAFDFANYFCEWMADYSDDSTCREGLDCNEFPSVENQRRLCSAYLGNDDPDSINNLLKEIPPYVHLSHLLWTFWALHQSTISKIDFDYISYAKNRSDLLP